MWLYEQEFWRDFPEGWVVGVDEVGRGPLAGPLVVAAAAFRSPLQLPGINDSKKISESDRELLFEILKRKVEHYAVVHVSPNEIGSGNLHHLCLQALKQAVEKLPISPQLVLVDGKYPLPGLASPQRPVIGGDRTCASISCASILAKVTRDRLMIDLDCQYPGYGLAKHKGYPTVDHRQALQKLGPSPIHRANFGPVRAVLNVQLELFPKQKNTKNKGR